MRLNNEALLLFLLPLLAACSTKSSTSETSCTAGSNGASLSTIGLPNGPSITAPSGPNVLPFTINTSNCATSGGYSGNTPCGSVTLCDPGNASDCQTISNILIDTGSYGLRIFSSVVNSGLLATLTPVTNAAGNPIAECVSYADNSADWGPVVNANVILGSEAAVKVPIQLIDPSYGQVTVCNGGSVDASPSVTGFNGVLGVGLFQQDCGETCAQKIANGIYYSCTNQICAYTNVSLANQVTNPASQEAVDNNGVIMALPSLPSLTAESVDGYLVLGIGTQSNNQPSGVTAFDASSSGAYAGNFDISCSGQDYPGSFIDSGSNGIFFNAPSLNIPNCGGWYCPTQDLSALIEITGTSGSPSAYAGFTIGNYNTFVTDYPSNAAFSAIAGSLGSSNTSDTTFDLGLPFFYGRNVYVGFENTSSSVGNGTYWAF
ncbi:MAG: DUF3443 family protein [Oligoflexia bacterium]|nr:DUF3443 family protein [Oligoflexia bacterium]